MTLSRTLASSSHASSTAAAAFLGIALASPAWVCATDTQPADAPDEYLITDLIPQACFLAESSARFRILGNVGDGSSILLADSEGAGYRIEFMIAVSMGGQTQALGVSGSGRSFTYIPDQIPVQYGKLAMKNDSMLSLDWFKGAEHIYMGKAVVGGYRFESDTQYPLAFKVTETGLFPKRRGYQYLCGRGTLTNTKSGSSVRLGFRDRPGLWIGWLKEASPLRRQRAAQALGWIGGAEGCPPLIEALRDAHVRPYAAEALGRSPEQATAAAALVPLLKGEDVAAAPIAAESLGRLGRPGASALLDLLKDPQAQTVAIGGLAVSKDDRALRALLAIARDAQRDGKTRGAAVGALTRMGTPDCVRAVAQLTGDPDREVRLKAVEATSKLRPDGMVTTLKRIAKSDSDEEIRKAAANAVKQLESPPETRPG